MNNQNPTVAIADNPDARDIVTCTICGCFIPMPYDIANIDIDRYRHHVQAFIDIHLTRCAGRPIVTVGPEAQ